MIDLHTHSTASDGSDSPAEVARKAREAGLAAAALTDHDTVSGLGEFLSAAKELGLRAVPGVEISTWHMSKELHIAGLFIDPENQRLLEFLEHLRAERLVRNRAIVAKLEAAGYPVTEAEVNDVAGGESVGRPHIARVLVQKGLFAGIQEVFDALLKRGCSAFVPRVLPHPEEAIAVIHAAGGLAIWAHPVSGQHSGERSFVKKMLKHLTAAGLDGIETRYTMFTPKQSMLLDELAEKFHLLRSGGSDYHGINQPATKLGTGTGGLAVPDEYLSAMDERLANGQTVIQPDI